MFLKLLVKTSEEDYAGMTVFGQLDVVICSHHECCLIYNIDSSSNDFETGATDVFTEGDLQQCYGFNLDASDYSITLAHHGTDAWLGEYILITAGDRIFCEINGWLDNGDTYNLHTCNIYNATQRNLDFRPKFQTPKKL